MCPQNVSFYAVSIDLPYTLVISHRNWTLIWASSVADKLSLKLKGMSTEFEFIYLHQILKQLLKFLV